MARALRHDGLRQVAVVLAAVAAYELLRMGITPDWPVALAHARDVASLERAAHVAWEAPLQHAFLRVPDVVWALNVFYLVHFAATGLFFVWLYRGSRRAFGVYRDAFLLATAAALAVHVAYPSAPPRLAGVGLVDTLRALSGIRFGSVSDPVAALPSLHAGWAVGVGIGLWRRSRVVAIAYPAAVVLTILVTGNHFVVDAVAGAATMVFALAVVQFASRRGVEQSGSSPGS